MLTPIERAVFGPVAPDAVLGWLHRLVRSRLSSELDEVLFRAGRLSPVYGLRLDGGAEVVVKVHRDPVDVSRLRGTVRCQRLLADAGYPCPQPLDGPAPTAGHVATVESLVARGAPADAHEPAIRQAMVRSLAEQVELLRSVPAGSLGPGAPAWARYEDGPWPTPHDPVFDFTATPDGYEWLDATARQAAEVLGPRSAPEVSGPLLIGPMVIGPMVIGPMAIGHCDWVAQNLRFVDGAVSVAYDWDSLVGHSEPVIAGLAAGAFTEGSTAGSDAPAPQDVAAFLTDYDGVRPGRFTDDQRRAATAAAAWVLAYNARCWPDAVRHGTAAAAGSPLEVLSRHRDAYLRLRW